MADGSHNQGQAGYISAGIDHMAGIGLVIAEDIDLGMDAAPAGLVLPAAGMAPAAVGVAAALVYWGPVDIVLVDS